MEEKILVDKKMVQSVKTVNAAGFVIAIVLLGIGVIAALVALPGFTGFFVALILAGFIVLFSILRKKNSVKKVYFLKKPVTRKFNSPTSDSNEDLAFNYYLVFDDKKTQVTEDLYRGANEGDLFYVMYNEKNGQIVSCYEIDKYELDPSLDIRT